MKSAISKNASSMTNERTAKCSVLTVFVCVAGLFAVVCRAQMLAGLYDSAKRNADGAMMCRVDTPAATTTVKSKSQCSDQCLRDDSCQSFNYRDTRQRLSVCERFNYVSCNLTAVQNCSHYRQQEKVSAEAPPPRTPCLGLPNVTVFLAVEHRNHECKVTKKCIDIPGRVPPLKIVMCIDNWIIMQNKVYNGSVSFSKPWSDYRDGFGSLTTTDNYWLGLETVYRLTSAAGYKLRVEIQRNTGPTWYWAEYSSFSISSESTNYRLNVAGYTGTATDTLIGSSAFCANGSSFSTRDRDNDGCPGSCVTSWGGFGWWFNWCTMSLLNAQGLACWQATAVSDVAQSRMLFSGN